MTVEREAELSLHPPVPDARRLGGHAVIGDHALAHPKIAAAQDPADCEVAFGRVSATLRLDPGPAPEALPRLRIVQDRIVGVDRVLSVDVPTFGGLPVLPNPSPKVGFTIAVHLLVPRDPYESHASAL